MTPEAVEEQVRRPPAQLPRPGRAWSASPATTCRACPGVGPKTAAKWINQFGDLDEIVARVDEITGKAGESLREHLADVIRNRRINELVRDLDAAGQRRRPGRSSRGTATRCTQSSTAWSSGCCATGCSRRCRPTSRRSTEAATVDGHAARARRGGRLARPSTQPATRSPASTSQGSWGSGTGQVDAVALADATRCARRGSTPPRSAPTTRPRSPPGWPTRTRPKALHDAKGPMLALAARGWPLRGLAADTALSAYLSHPDQRSYDLADLTLRYLHRELKGRGRGTDQLSFDLDGDSAEAQDVDAAGACRRRPGRRRSRPSCRARGGSQLLADVELPLVDVLATMEQAGIAVDIDHLTIARGAVRRPGQAGRRRRVRRDRQADQPRLAQAAAGGAVRRARHAEDQAHQDRLHHRRRGAAGPLRQDRAPVPAAPAGRTATSRGCGRPSRGCSRRSPTTAASTPRSTR